MLALHPQGHALNPKPKPAVLRLFPYTLCLPRYAPWLFRGGHRSTPNASDAEDASDFLSARRAGTSSTLLPGPPRPTSMAAATPPPRRTRSAALAGRDFLVFGMTDRDGYEP
jgi:hypothetical protein